MATGTTVRLPEPLKAEATAYAEGIGISLNALIAVALRDYLDHPMRRAEAPPQSLPDMDLPPLEAYPEAADPEDMPPQAIPKVGRNASCPCGSGKKYKLCHGR